MTLIELIHWSVVFLSGAYLFYVLLDVINSWKEDEIKSVISEWFVPAVGWILIIFLFIVWLWGFLI